MPEERANDTIFDQLIAAKGAASVRVGIGIVDADRIERNAAIIEFVALPDNDVARRVGVENLVSATGQKLLCRDRCRHQNHRYESQHHCPLWNQPSDQLLTQASQSREKHQEILNKK